MNAREGLAPMVLRLSIALSVILIALNIGSACSFYRAIHSREISPEVADLLRAHGVSDEDIHDGSVRQMDFAGGTVVHIHSVVVFAILLGPILPVGLAYLLHAPSMTTRLGRIALPTAIISSLINLGIITAISCGLLN